LKNTTNSAARRVVSAVAILALSNTLFAQRAAAAAPPPPPPPQFGQGVTTANQLAVANVLNSIQTTAVGDMAAIINQLNSFIINTRVSALAQMASSAFVSIPSISFSGVAAQNGAVSSRLSNLRIEMTADADRNRGPYPGVLLADGIGDTNAGLLSDPAKKAGYFAAAVGAAGRQFADNDSSGYDFNGEGVTFGGDYRVTDWAAIGVSGGYLHSHGAVDQGLGTIDGDMYKYGLYGTALRGAWHADAYAGGGRDYYSSNRVISAFGRQAASSPQAHELNMMLSVGYDLAAGALVVTPFGGVTHDEFDLGSFGENGAGALDLNVAAKTTESTKVSAGVRLKPAGERRFTPFFSLAYQHEAASTARSLTSSFAGGGQAFSTTLATPGPEAALVGAGCEARLSKNAAARLGYNGEFRSNYESHALNADVRVKF
jgi:outer membrane autotransporter protein